MGGVWRSVQQLDRVVSPGGNVPSLTLPIFYQEVVSPAPYSTAPYSPLCQTFSHPLHSSLYTAVGNSSKFVIPLCQTLALKTSRHRNLCMIDDSSGGFAWHCINFIARKCTSELCLQTQPTGRLFHFIPTVFCEQTYVTSQVIQ